jgi:hypothetical protein
MASIGALGLYIFLFATGSIPLLCLVISSWHHTCILAGIEPRTMRLLGVRGNALVTALTAYVLRLARLYPTAMALEASSRERKLKLLSPAPGGIGFLGDSTFNYWGPLEACIPGAFNAGFGGSRSADLIKHAHRLVMRWSPSRVVIHVGGNDWDTGEIRKTQDAIETLALIVRNSGGSAPVSVVLFFTPRAPQYSDAKWAFLSDLRRALIDARYDYIDMSDHTLGSRSYLADGVHFSLYGYRTIGRYIGEGLTALDHP